MEIERKFLVAAIPAKIEQVVGERIAQGYLFHDKGELRIRKRDASHFLTLKGDGSVSREEWEVAMPEWAFASLWERTAGARVEKIRYTLPEGALNIEVDVFEGNLKGLCLVECEFSNEEQARNFTPPAWIGAVVDVTDDKRYKNKSLSTKGRPA